MKRIAITGSSGYFGQKLVEKLKNLHPDAEILGMDVNPPTDNEPDRFIKLDVRSEKLFDHLKTFKPDTVIHLAFIVNPMHDEDLMHDINIGGTRNVLNCVAELSPKPKRFFVASSATAYGAFFDNPIPMDESWPVRPRKEFTYAADKTEMDLMVAAFADAQPKIAVAWVRPAIIYGPGVENYLSRTIINTPFSMKIDGYDLPMQFVHEDDVVDASILILEKNARGPFNLAPPDHIYASEIANVMGKPLVHVPFKLMYAASWAMWKAKLKDAESPPGSLYFFKYPWVMAPKRLTEELNYTFQFSSKETLEVMIASRNS